VVCAQVDDNFKMWARDQVGPVAWDAWCDSCPAEYLVFMGDWERVKCTFHSDKAVSGPLHIPHTLLETMTDDDRAALSVNHEGYDDRLYMEEDTMKGFFDPVLGAVDRLVRDMLQGRPDVKVDRALLVGGFGSSKYFEQCVRAGLRGITADVIVPPKASTAVLLGKCCPCP
jgi:hypothetical protein